MSYVILSQDGDELVTLEEAKAHLRIDSDYEDGIIEVYIKAAREHCERFLGLSLVEQTIKATILKSKTIRQPLLLRFDDVPARNVYPLPLSPVIEIEQVTDGDGEPVEFEAYLDAIPAVLSVDDMPEVLNVTYKTGTATANMTMKIAVLMILHQIYEYRGDIPDNVTQRVEEAYLRQYRVNLGMA
jgi:uncharacterized phiE125 gp8 family phage protein